MWRVENCPCSTRITDVGIAICHSRGRILFYTAGSRNGLEGVGIRGTDTQKEVDPEKNTLFVIEKYVEDVRQEEKDVPNLLEAIMRPTCLVKEELRKILYEMSQFGPNIPKIKVSTFWILEIRRIPAGGQCQPPRQ